MSKQKVAYITGGAQGIGKSIVERLVRDGFAVGIADLDLDLAQQLSDELNNNGGKTLAIQVNVSNREQVFHSMEEVASHFGDLNVVINNAGISPNTPIETIDQEKLEQVLGINVAGVVWGIQGAVQQFERFGHGGKIINATSQAAITGEPGLSLYSGSKFAVRGISQAAARELAEKNITVNTYAPGAARTQMVNDVINRMAEETGKDPDEIDAELSKNIALGRMSTPEEVASLVSFLAGSDSDYITGQTILVDGGMKFL